MAVDPAGSKKSIPPPIPGKTEEPGKAKKAKGTHATPAHATPAALAHKPYGLALPKTDPKMIPTPTVRARHFGALAAMSQPHIRPGGEDRSAALAKELDYRNAKVTFRDGEYYITGDRGMTEANILNAARSVGLVVNYGSVKENKSDGGFVLRPNKGMSP